MEPHPQRLALVFPCWFDRDIINCIALIKIAHLKWERSNLISDFIEFKKLRAQSCRMIHCVYKRFIAETLKHFGRSVITQTL